MKTYSAQITTMKKRSKGFYITTIHGREFWIQSPRFTETPFWRFYEATQGFGITTEESFLFDTKKEAMEHLAAITLDLRPFSN